VTDDTGKEAEAVTKPGRTLAVVATPGNADGSGYYRMYQPFRQLARRSRHLVMIPPPREGQHEIPSPADLTERGIDVYVAQRPASPHHLRLWEAIAGQVATVYETDDDILGVHPSSGLAILSEGAQECIRRLAACCDLVTCSTAHLAEVMSRYNRNVTVLENVVHEEVLNIRRARPERVTVGWAGGSSHLMDIASAAAPVRDVLGAHPEADMHFIGVDYSPLVCRESRYTPWERDVWDYYRGVDFDIGLCPLADHPFNYSKSHLKALDYAALGIPVIAQDLPPYREFVVDGVTGYLVRTGDEWRARLSELISDAGAREEMGAKARAVAAQHTIQEHWVRWERAYEASAR
jgi:glycosyltransferase involved in cell wall biosynthesis